MRLYFGYNSGVSVKVTAVRASIMGLVSRRNKPTTSAFVRGGGVRTAARASCDSLVPGRRTETQSPARSPSSAIHTLFAWFISHQPTVFFSYNKPATSNQPTVLFSQNKPAPATSQPNRLSAGDSSPPSIPCSAASLDCCTPVSQSNSQPIICAGCFASV
jgi:hypothetical protein